MTWRPGPDGILTHPKRGFPGPLPDGYVVRTGNPFLADLVLEPCEKRELRSIKRRCCGAATIVHFYCQHYQRKILRKDCVGCPYRS